MYAYLVPLMEGEMMDEERTLTAYHEAGHAVVAYVLKGLRTPSVSIIPNDRSAGRIRGIYPEGFDEYWEDAEDVADKIFERALAVTYAGIKAVEIHTGRAVDPDDPNLDFDVVGTDGDLASELTSHLTRTGDEEGQLEVSRRALDTAEAVLRDYWPKVRRLADLLLEHGEADHQVIEALMVGGPDSEHSRADRFGHPEDDSDIAHYDERGKRLRVPLVDYLREKKAAREAAERRLPNP